LCGEMSTDSSTAEAIKLLYKWDDFDILIAYGSNLFGYEYDAFEDEDRQRCLDWLLSDGNFILTCASEWIQTWGAACDPDMADRDDPTGIDIDLAMSMFGPVLFLDELEKLNRSFARKLDFIHDLFGKTTGRKSNLIDKALTGTTPGETLIARLPKREVSDEAKKLRRLVVLDGGRDDPPKEYKDYVELYSASECSEFKAVRRLLKGWILEIFIFDSNDAPMPVDQVQIDTVRSSHDGDIRWIINLEGLELEERWRLLVECPLIIQMIDGEVKQVFFEEGADYEQSKPLTKESQRLTE